MEEPKSPTVGNNPAGFGQSGTSGKLHQFIISSRGLKQQDLKKYLELQFEGFKATDEQVEKVRNFPPPPRLLTGALCISWLRLASKRAPRVNATAGRASTDRFAETEREIRSHAAHAAFTSTFSPALPFGSSEPAEMLTVGQENLQDIDFLRGDGAEEFLNDLMADQDG